MRRRSIVQFEDWLDEEIATVQTNIDAMTAEAEATKRELVSEEIKLATLRRVKTKLAPVVVVDEALDLLSEERLDTERVP